jgi:hypothetical protein
MFGVDVDPVEPGSLSGGADWVKAFCASRLDASRSEKLPVLASGEDRDADGTLSSKDPLLS